MLIYGFPAEQGARRLFSALGESGSRPTLGRTAPQDPPEEMLRSLPALAAPLRPGQQPGKTAPVSFSTDKGHQGEQPALVSQSRPRHRSHRSSTWAQGAGSQPEDLLTPMNLVSPASLWDGWLPPMTTGTKLLKNFTQPREVSEQYTHLQTESTHALTGLCYRNNLLFCVCLLGL